MLHIFSLLANISVLLEVSSLPTVEREDFAPVERGKVRIITNQNKLDKTVPYIP